MGFSKKLFMKLIVGFGNPGDAYNWTRHNFGALALDFYAKVHHLDWEKQKMHALWLKDGDRIFLKSQYFYNDVGLAVKDFANYYKIAPTDILAICDDFDLPFGTLRFRSKGSSGGNNGLSSMIHHLGTEDFPRLRLGTNNDELRTKLSDVDFVLSRFSPEEKQALPDLLLQISRAIDEHAS